MKAPAPDAVELQIPLNVHDGWPPTQVEALWARPVPGKPDLLRVDNVPVFAVELAREDVVRIERIGGQATLVEVVRRGGHSTLRVIIDSDGDSDRIDDVAESLSELGGGVQRTFIDALLTVDIRPGADAAPLIAWLDQAEADGRLEWEEGWLAEAHRPVLH
jgi:hypothetical protein